MFSIHVFFMIIVAVNSITKCYSLTFSENISKGKVNGVKIKFCEYKLLKMLPKSTILDTEACLFCSCRSTGLTCNDINDKPGCEMMPGGLFPQNPFDNRWKVMVDKLINSKYVGKYRVLQVKTQVVAGSNTYLKLLVKDRLCDLTIFTNLKQEMEITDDSCNLEKITKKKPYPKTVNEEMIKLKKRLELNKLKNVKKTYLKRTGG